MVINWFKQLDELLRGERVRGDLLLKGKIDLDLKAFVPLAIILGAAYGFFMGLYALLASWAWLFPTWAPGFVPDGSGRPELSG